jgi:hypothetical protein
MKFLPLNEDLHFLYEVFTLERSFVPRYEFLPGYKVLYFGMNFLPGNEVLYLRRYNVLYLRRYNVLYIGRYGGYEVLHLDMKFCI